VPPAAVTRPHGRHRTPPWWQEVQVRFPSLSSFTGSSFFGGPPKGWVWLIRFNSLWQERHRSIPGYFRKLSLRSEEWGRWQPVQLPSLTGLWTTFRNVWAFSPSWHITQRSPTYLRIWYFSEDPCGSWQMVHSPADIGPCRKFLIRSFRFSSWHLKQRSCPCAITLYRLGLLSNWWQGAHPPIVIGPWTNRFPVSSLWQPRQKRVAVANPCASDAGGLRSWHFLQAASFFSVWKWYSGKGDSIPIPIFGSRKRTIPWFTFPPNSSITDSSR